MRSPDCARSAASTKTASARSSVSSAKRRPASTDEPLIPSGTCVGVAGLRRADARNRACRPLGLRTDAAAHLHPTA